MNPITIDNPAWYTTFPHLVAPRDGEWLVGLLLRCDDANHWQSGGSLAYLLGASQRRKLIRGVGLMKREHFEKLANVLALSLAAIAVTTYQAELERLSNAAGQPLELSSTPPLFHICPLCVAEDRVLSRTLALSGVTHCPRHQVLLVRSCLCGEPLHPFDQQTLPFTCGGCGLDWSRLPGVNADRGQVEAEGKLLSYYEFFLSTAAPPYVACALRLIAERQATQGRGHRARRNAGPFSLEKMVGRLMELGFSPDDIQLAVNERPDHLSKEVGQ